MRILFVPYGTERAPATRYRVMQYIPLLKQAGIKCTVFSAISRFATNLMIGSPDFNNFVRPFYYLYITLERFIRLLLVIIIAPRFDVVYLQRTTFPCNLEKLLKLVSKYIIFDIDDAIYLPDKQSDDLITHIKKYIKEKEAIKILKASDIVTVENEYIKNFVSKYCATVAKIPGPIDTDRFVKGKKSKDRKEVVIGWIGSPATTDYLHMLDDVFGEISKKYNFVKFNFIGLGKYTNPNIRFEKIEWRYDTEVSNLQDFDIGIMPMPNDEWTKGKLGCKMLQYMSSAIPAVVSFTPTNAEIIENSKNGFFANNEKEWIDTLSLLIEDVALRENIGLRGQETILKNCSLIRNIEKLKDIFAKKPR